MNIGGREKVVLDLVKHIDKSIFDVEIACLGTEGTLYENFRQLNVTLHFFRKGPGLDIWLFERLRKFIQNGRYRIVHCHNPGALLYGGVAAKLSNVPRIINTEHGYGNEISKRKVIAETILRNRISKTVAVSNDLRKNLYANFMAKKNKIITIHNGISCKSSKSGIDKAAFKKSIGINSGDYVIGTVGRLETVKDHKTLIEAFNIVNRQSKKTKLIIVGDGKEKDSLHKTVQNLKLEKCIIFTGERNDINDLLDVMDVFVLSSLSEGVSITLLEAMRHGIPIIATSVGGNKEVIENQKTGILVAKKNPMELSAYLLFLRKNIELANSLKDKARERVMKDFNITTILKRYESLYTGEM